MPKLMDVFETQELAQQALAFISSIGQFPTYQDSPRGKNVLTTTAWDIEKQRITDKKWYFLRVNDEIRADFPQEVIDTYNTIPHTEEIFDSSWEPETDMGV